MAMVCIVFHHEPMRERMPHQCWLGTTSHFDIGGYRGAWGACQNDLPLYLVRSATWWRQIHFTSLHVKWTSEKRPKIDVRWYGALVWDKCVKGCGDPRSLAKGFEKSLILHLHKICTKQFFYFFTFFSKFLGYFGQTYGKVLKIDLK